MKRGMLPDAPPPKKTHAKEYFTGFVLNKDPKASAYMPFDSVYFPKLFDKEVGTIL